MRLVVPASTVSVERALAGARSAPTSFDPSTRDDGRAYEHDLLGGVVGRGEGGFAVAASGLRSWATHRVAGVRVFPAGVPVLLDRVYLVTFGTPVLAMVAPCRVTDLVDEPGRAGFTYATLAGHPEEGEERFAVELDASGEVRCTIEATSRPASGLLRATTPVNRLVQHHVAHGYLRALRRHVARHAEQVA